MNKLRISLALFVLLNLGCEKKDPILTSSPLLSEEEISDLIFLRQEEKLAGDIYSYAFEIYGVNIFSNITSSERTHAASVLNLLNVYKIDDPVPGYGNGKFKDTGLQTLYNQLKEIVGRSKEDALIAGATIEDLDIRDIQDFYRNTERTDILKVYDQLQCGSRNHMRAFTGQLEQLSLSYSPQYISMEEFNNIVNSGHEQCNK